MRSPPRHILGPLILVAVALLLNLAVALRPSPVIDLGLIDLTPGATTHATFRAAYAESYGIGVRMDRDEAERLFPCTVSVEAMQTSQCKIEFPSWPVALALRASSSGRDVSSEITPTESVAGGEYEGAHAYTWFGAYIRPVPGRTYQLDVRSIGRPSHLQAAHRTSSYQPPVLPASWRGLVFSRLRRWS